MSLWTFGALFRRQSIAFYGDFIDPFCFLGFHELAQAARECGKTIAWHGFELNPDTPAEGMPLATAGNSDLRRGMWPSVQSYAQQIGVEIQEPQFVPNTRLAHLLALHWPGKSAVKIPLIHRIYQAYLSERKDIGNPSVLIELASRFGVEQKQCHDLLTRHASAKPLDHHRRQAMQWAFPGLPGMRFRNQTYFGAIRAAEWRRVFNS